MGIILNLLKKSLLYIVIILLCLVSQRSMAASGQEKAEEFQLAALQPLFKQDLPRAKEAILYPQLFSSTETKSDDISIFPKWTNVLARYRGQTQRMAEPCPDEACPVKDWQNFLATIKNKPLKQKVSLVNRYINQVSYVTDSKNWKTNDYWQTPMEFFKHSGDCEDYAIAKYISLRALGVSEDAMRVVVVNDEYLRSIHAVLVVYINGQAYVLDNQIKQMVNAKLVRHYQPIYSINETSWWRHRVS